MKNTGAVILGAQIAHETQTCKIMQLNFMNSARIFCAAVSVVLAAYVTMPRRNRPQVTGEEVS
jgi:hypothetical protein